MTERDLAAGGIDTTTPNVARIYGPAHLSVWVSRRD
jgi:hypothetical protein